MTQAPVEPEQISRSGCAAPAHASAFAGLQQEPSLGVADTVHGVPDDELLLVDDPLDVLPPLHRR